MAARWSGSGAPVGGGAGRQGGTGASRPRVEALVRSAAADTGKCGRVFFVKTVLSDPLKQDCGFISK